MSVVTPHRLAELLGLPQPTDEQAAVIGAPLGPLLVVAGAGSGKTETMASRVVYLVANRMVRPEQVLGLTFTRKAAGELSTRIRARLSQLARIPEIGGEPAGPVIGRPDDRPGASGAPGDGPAEAGAPGDAFGGAGGAGGAGRGGTAETGAREQHSVPDALGGEPTVATYHSYAARVVTEHGLRAGYEPTTRLLSEAACWQLADAVVRAYDGDMSAVDLAPVTVTGEVLGLAAELSEHLCDPDRLHHFTERLIAGVRDLPGSMSADTARMVARQQARLQLLPLVTKYIERKVAAEAMDYGDQLSRAATVAVRHPIVGATERDRYRVVLLDEYQDTSHAQVVLLRALFGRGHAVTAVGDPAQSIYAWRGASAGTLERFPTDFALADGRPARRLSLTTSWRNPPSVLSVANEVSRPLRDAGSAAVVLSAAPHAPYGRAVRCALLGTAADEASWVAGTIARHWSTNAPADDPPTTAVLVRSRRQIPVLEQALRARGLPVEVVGLGGLLDTPEVRDVVTTLQVLADPAAGAGLLRLLTGPRLRIGPRDIVALHRRSRELSRRDRPNLPELALPTEVTLVEALDDPGDPALYSPTGYRRLTAFAAELAALRARLDQSLPDLIADVERTIGLDVEVAVRAAAPAAPTGSPDAAGGLARAHLDAFGDVAAQFAADSDTATLAGFLAFLAAAEEQERGLEPGHVEVVTGAVQVLTVHAAKGLEWDVVALAGAAEAVFPARPQGDHWLNRPGVLPFALRGDRTGLPELELSAVGDHKAFNRARRDFLARWAEHDAAEERRLAYVAVTRPCRLLLCSGYWWDGDAQRRRGPSALLTEVRERCLAGAGYVDEWADEPPPDAPNPVRANPLRAQWPEDPLGDRRAGLTAAADLVRAELAALRAADRAGTAGGADPVDTADRAGTAGAESSAAAAEVPAAGGGAVAAEERRWASEVELLLAERDTEARGVGEVALPSALTVTDLVGLADDPGALARRIRRPLPRPPERAASRGTEFHRWLERRLGSQALLDLDELPGAADRDAGVDADLAQLQRRFLASEWATRTPVAVEVPFVTVLAGVVVRGRMDAVFAEPDGGLRVVDWKTGRVPTGDAARAATVQLAAYRLAAAELFDVPLPRVGAAFHYVATGVTDSPADLLDADGLAALVTRLPAAGGEPVTEQ
ncbi:ATP-dependent DNA helicase [Actinocatenispora thailandica]|uniref:DNA 3'-5' helicase n=1 Tax=Actinocatenispora thailandica TaxID=227318 RepID=A0A7R7HZ55_9ACTN|nr:ATP-dependent DNA helicase [Actinocatenispora thailandica]BCJ36994.1 ATP-dependent DNA helicase [Actinocatenispora thailandica]